MCGFESLLSHQFLKTVLNKILVLKIPALDINGQRRYEKETLPQKEDDVKWM
jgi:hypothetical protein